MSALKRLEQWFRLQCNGEWEHSYGVSISSLDNPGWRIEIDLAETAFADLQIARTRRFLSEEDWLDYCVTDGKFVGNGDPGKLEDLLNIFFSLVGAPIP